MDLTRRALALLTVPVSALVLLMNLLSSPPPAAELTTVLAASEIAQPAVMHLPEVQPAVVHLPPEDEAADRFVTIAEVDSGWLLRDGTGQWLSAECRSGLEHAGMGFEIVAWETIEQTALPTVEVPCDQIAGEPPVDAFEHAPTPTPAPAPVAAASFERGINLAGDFDVTPRGSWGAPIGLSDLDAVAQAGFDHVRIPIRWSAHTGPAPSFTIDPVFFAEVDTIVQRATDLGLGVMVNVHHFEELDADPAGERAHYLAIWSQLAAAYANAPASVVFELLNEPAGVFVDRPAVWNELAAQALAVVRRTNATRTVVIGPVGYNHPSQLDALALPNDPNVMATIHTYDPAEFTHQGAVWANPMPPTGQTWEPNTRRIGLEWFDLSWGVELDERPDGVSITFEERYMALAIGRDQAISSADLVALSADRAFDAVILCNYADADPVVVEVVFNRSLQGIADISTCGPIESLAIQTLEDGRSTVTLDRLALCSTTCDELIITQAEALTRQIQDAAAWADAQGVELYLGEFGTLDPTGTPTDVRSRIEWTRTVRELAEEFGIGWGAFNLTGEFGIYDQATGTWDGQLLGALLG